MIEPRFAMTHLRLENEKIRLSEKYNLVKYSLRHLRLPFYLHDSYNLENNTLYTLITSASIFCFVLQH